MERHNALDIGRQSTGVRVVIAPHAIDGCTGTSRAPPTQESLNAHTSQNQSLCCWQCVSIKHRTVHDSRMRNNCKGLWPQRWWLGAASRCACGVAPREALTPRRFCVFPNPTSPLFCSVHYRTEQNIKNFDLDHCTAASTMLYLTPLLAAVASGMPNPCIDPTLPYAKVSSSSLPPSPPHSSPL